MLYDQVLFTIHQSQTEQGQAEELLVELFYMPPLL
jgi:hypothetical protein